jgi:hypothetical protein
MSKRLSLFAKRKAVTVGEVEITVNQMNWKDAILFAIKIAEKSAVFLENAKSFSGLKAKVASASEGDSEAIRAAIQNLCSVIVGIVSGDEGLVCDFLQRITDLGVEEINNLPAEGAFNLIEAGIKLNFSEELVKKSAGLMANLNRLGGQAGESTTPTP